MVVEKWTAVQMKVNETFATTTSAFLTWPQVSLVAGEISLLLSHLGIFTYSFKIPDNKNSDSMLSYRISDNRPSDGDEGTALKQTGFLLPFWPDDCTLEQKAPGSRPHRCLGTRLGPRQRKSTLRCLAEPGCDGCPCWQVREVWSSWVRAVDRGHHVLRKTSLAVEEVMCS